MEAFSLLKYWRGGGAVVGTDATAFANSRTAAANTTILTAVAEDRDESDSDSESDGDDGPFFDLEFSVPDEDESEPRDPDPVGNSTNDSDSEAQPEDNDDEDEESDEREFNFTVSSGSPRDHTGDPNLTLSPSDDLFFKGKLVPIEPSSIEFNPSEEPNSKPQFAGALLKSATKFRVFMLGLKKPKPNPTNSNGSSEKSEKTEPPVVSAEPPLKPPNSPQKTQAPQLKTQAPGQQKQKQQGKLFTVKFKVEEVPIVSLFTRDNSSRISAANKPPQTTAVAQQKPMISASEESASSEDKRFPKEVVQKYLKMVKPLYVRVSKRYGEKLRLSGQLSLSGSHSAPASSPVASAEKSQTQPGTEVAPPPSTAGGSGKSGQKQGNFPAGLKVVCKHLGKSRSASSAVAAAPSTAVVSQRRDDSLLQQQDGIQSAILHCKRSFNASRDLDSSLLPRSVNDSSKEKSVEVSSKSLDQGKGVSL